MRFYGSLRGNGRTEATKGGHKGIEGHVRGWDLGVLVKGSADEQLGDVFAIWITHGSNDDTARPIGHVLMRDGERVFEPIKL